MTCFNVLFFLCESVYRYVLSVVHFIKVFIDIFLVLYTLLFCEMKVVLEFETYDKGFYENVLPFRYMKPNHYIV